MAEIRKAVLADVPALIELGRQMHDESPRFRRYAFSADRLQTSLLNILQLDQCCAFVAEKDEEVIGGILGIAVDHYACELKQASDLAFFMHRAHRGSTAAVRLVRAYVEWAIEQGAEPSIGINTGVNPERTARLFHAIGGRQSGTTWTWGG